MRRDYLADITKSFAVADVKYTVASGDPAGTICYLAAAQPDALIAMATHSYSGVRRWLHTGDLGYVDDDGYVFIVDRKKDLIKTSGFQVWPREVEEVLATHPAVAEVGVAGIADRVRGETVKAWVVLREGAEVTDQELRSFCRDRLAPYKSPSHIEFRTELPKTMVGKVLRRALRDGRA